MFVKMYVAKDNKPSRGARKRVTECPELLVNKTREPG